MKLLTTDNTPSAARVDFFLHEKGIDIEREQVALMSGEHKSPEYRARVPNGRIPALELDDGTVICESMAICRYFEATQPTPSLFGDTPLAQAQVEMWQRMMELELFMPMAMSFRHTHEKAKLLENPQVPAFGEAQRNVAESRLRRFDRELADKEFITGNALSVADITAYCGLRFFRFMGYKPLDDQPNLGRWFTAMAQRPAAQAAFGDS